MFHLVAWQESLAEATTPTNLAAVTDPTVHVSGDYVYVPAGMNKIIWGAGRGNDMVYFAINSPSLRALFRSGMGPVDNLTAAQHDRTPNANYIGNNPITLVEREGVEALYEKLTGGTDIMSAAIALAAGPVIPATGEVHSIDFSSTITSVTGAWVSGAITFDQTLPAGRYAVVGGLLWGLYIVFFRLVFPGAAWRPGGIGTHDDQTTVPWWQRNGGLGVWGEFDHDVPPSLELLADSATSNAVGGCLDLIKIP